MNDHVCYVVTDMKTPWYAPQSSPFDVVTNDKLGIYHIKRISCS
jgi:hypothetical protein